MKVVYKLQLDDDFDTRLQEGTLQVVIAYRAAERGELNAIDVEAAQQVHTTEVRRLVHQAYRLGLKQGIEEKSNA